MALTSPATLTAPSIAIGRALIPYLKRLHAERQAGADDARVDVNLLDASFEASLQRLANIGDNGPWWRQLLSWAEASYVDPDYLTGASIRNWLFDREVRKDLKELARRRLFVSTDGEDVAIARLAARYAVYTLEDPRLSAGRIDAVINILLAGTLSQLNAGDQVLAGFLQHAHQQTFLLLSEIQKTLENAARNPGYETDRDRAEARSRVYKILPAQYRALHGRRSELEELKELFSETAYQTTVAITAYGGMGKTALARQFCIDGEVWNSFDVVLGAQALKRQIGISTRRSRASMIRFEQQGKELNLQAFLVELAHQLHIGKPDLKTASVLEREISERIKGRSALVVLDNLETAADTDDILKLLDRICIPPLQKALVTTRHYPSDHPTSFRPLPLDSMADVDSRLFVADLLRESQISYPIHDEAIDAIVDVARGHPLSLKLLTGKLATQGVGSILALRKDWLNASAGFLNDEVILALCAYIFDEKFMEHIGPTGEYLLAAIAASEAGQEEDKLRSNIDMSEDAFEEALNRLFSVNCLQRELYGQYSVLTMHSITRGFFRTKLL